MLPRCRDAGFRHLTGLRLLQTIRMWNFGPIRTSGWKTLTMTQPICGRLLFVARLNARLPGNSSIGGLH